MVEIKYLSAYHYFSFGSWMVRSSFRFESSHVDLDVIGKQFRLNTELFF